MPPKQTHNKPSLIQYDRITILALPNLELDLCGTNTPSTQILQTRMTKHNRARFVVILSRTPTVPMPVLPIPDNILGNMPLEVWPVRRAERTAVVLIDEKCLDISIGYVGNRRIDPVRVGRLVRIQLRIHSTFVQDRGNQPTYNNTITLAGQNVKRINLDRLG